MRHWKIGIAVVLLVGALMATATTTGTAKKSGNGTGAGLATVLSGKNEINPDTGKKRAGDLDGFGVFAATIQGDQLCYALAVGGINTPVAAHIHAAKRNKNGPIVVPLQHPTTSPGASSECKTVDAALLAAIKKHPNRYYVNVHTGDFPNGAIRGQLKKSKSK
jgi:CHRD domain